MKKKQRKCYLYTRVSTTMQVDGYSLDAQRDKLRKYADYEDMVVAGEYSDEGFSGKNIQGRPEFQRMLNDIQEGKDGVSYVLVFKLSRFGRNAADVLNSLQLMQDFGVNLICVEDGIDSSKDAGKLMISVLSAVAEMWSNSLSFPFMTDSMRPSFLKKIGIWHRKSESAIPSSGRRSTIQTMPISCPAF